MHPSFSTGASEPARQPYAPSSLESILSQIHFHLFLQHDFEDLLAE